MRISESCAACLYDKQKNKTDNEEYLSEIRELLDSRKESDTSPYMVYLFNKVHVRHFGAGADYKDIKKEYNDLVLEMEDSLREEIQKAEDPLAKALIMARIGNYIDFGAMNHVDQDEFLTLFRDNEMREDDRMMIACCNDGTRPVIFKIERIDIPETSEEEEWLSKQDFHNGADRAYTG